MPVARDRSNRLTALCQTARRLRDQGKGTTVTFSPKVFIPLTRLCRDFCGYCTFRQSPRQAPVLYMDADSVLAVARAGETLGCREALFVLGERPEERYPEARRWLTERGYESTLEYLEAMCRLVLNETALFPHINAGNMTRAELQALKPVAVSMGLMLENVSERLCEPSNVHGSAPGKHSRMRLETVRHAGELRIPFTTGLLIGIGETLRERIDTLVTIEALQRQHGHIQEVIVQNFCAKPQTPMARSAEPSLEEMLETIATARLVLGPSMNVQAPPNLAQHYGDGVHKAYLDAGINDFGGISPVTIDQVNPEAPWPHLAGFRKEIEQYGFQLRARYPVYPQYLEEEGFVTTALRNRIRAEAGPDGLMATETWNPSPASGAGPRLTTQSPA